MIPSPCSGSSHILSSQLQPKPPLCSGRCVVDAMNNEGLNMREVLGEMILWSHSSTKSHVGL